MKRRGDGAKRRGRVESCGGRGERMEGPKDRGGDTGPLLHCLTSSGIQPRARATNGGLSACLSLSSPISHTQQSHSKCTLHVQIGIYARFSA